MSMDAKRWNSLYPPGTRVIAYPAFRPEVLPGDTRLETVTRSVAWHLGGGKGEAVVMVEGYAGGISLDHVDVVPVIETNEEQP